MTLAGTTLQPLVPVWALALLVLPLLGLAVWQAVVAGRPGPGGAPRAGAPRGAWLRRAGAVVLLGIIGLGPSVASTDRDTSVANVDMFFVVDRTGSMAAEDYGPQGGQERLDGVRHDITSLTEAIPGARYSIISFDSQASRQLPLTTDARAITSWADTFHREITRYSQGSLTDRPLDELRSALQGSAEQHPANVRLVFFLSDGEQTAEGEPRSFADLAPLVDGGAVLGYGTSEGGRMKEYDPDVAPEDAEYIIDWSQQSEDGEPVEALSVIDEETLNALAEQLGVPYVHRQEPGETASLVAGVDPQQVAADGRRDVTAYRPVVWPFALALVALLGVEAWFWARSASRSLVRPAAATDAPSTGGRPPSGAPAADRVEVRR
ncbi:VWA domain-containing protein [Cellulosimicrobium sp. BIT-GX5]|uniref:VWA domain-containing protein n=1 Tax=Cellulosimicrobium composti TaxID=2672572 RepID=A0A6N7ZH12_9MICO|nr:VWA domain-containing protein [Cellulosimicrobium composti]MTG88618.1 VWA domain-containing protein [Cellulosimicrobium composti]